EIVGREARLAHHAADRFPAAQPAGPVGRIAHEALLWPGAACAASHDTRDSARSSTVLAEDSTRGGAPSSRRASLVEGPMLAPTERSATQARSGRPRSAARFFALERD